MWNITDIPGCKKFNGYKPCERGKVCPCSEPVKFGKRILIVNLDFIGDVLMTTATLPAIARKYPENTIHWITRGEAAPVLQDNPCVFKIWKWDDESRLILGHMEFDLVLNADKNQNSCAFTMGVSGKKKLGFGLHENGGIMPLNQGTEYSFMLGLDDDLKFRKNQRSGIDILAESWNLDYQHDEYVLVLSDAEKAFSEEYRKAAGADRTDVLIGLNTGCSAEFPNKKMTIGQHVMLIRALKDVLPDCRILLLGGRAETERNREINRLSGGLAIETPTTEGLRRGILYENACDIVVTGDTLGMHIAIGLKKQVVAWFGLSCASEIDLFGRGHKIMSDVDCAPCWKKECPDPICLDTLDIQAMAGRVKDCFKKLKQS